jgi:enamine deaminase RidA (YjgF/YER057c/UK114 family)
VAHELINPDGLPVPESYSHVVVAAGTRIVFVAGQVAEDADDNLVGAGDFAAQARQTFANVDRCLAAAGARPEQVTMLRIYVVGHRPEFLPLISEARISVFGKHKPADAIVGVERLAEDGRLIEIEATAVLD